jgi:hypothetical protein
MNVEHDLMAAVRIGFVARYSGLLCASQGRAGLFKRDVNPSAQIPGAK